MAGLIGKAANGLKLLLPALIPSWRFFDVIAPAPRVEYALYHAPDDAAQWQEFRPRPANVSPLQMLLRLFWNPVWNETLFLVSCAERLIDNPTEHCREEIFKRIGAELQRQGAREDARTYLQFRLVLVRRQEDLIEEEVAFVSSAQLVGSLHS